MYMNEHYGKNYMITQMQEAITTSVMDFQKRSPWGYQLFYYIAASNRVHPDYVSYLMNKRTLSVTVINEILSRIPDEQKLDKNMKLVESLYMDYQKNECDDTEDIRNLSLALKDRKVLMIGPGASVGRYRDRIDSYIKEEDPIVISINHIPGDHHPDYMFITNTVRFLQSVTRLHEEKNRDIKLIASSNLTKNERDFDYVINYSSVIDEEAEFPDNSMCMLVRVLIKCGCRAVVLAGFDGYTPDNVNYFDIDKAYSFLSEKAESLNAYAKRFFEEVKDRIEVSFITPSEYTRG
jgi:4-hydroxy 2-oxovalerate aldolase